jgi:enamine deaminase RidA (YjgF/YER057c/UK114 family)
MIKMTIYLVQGQLRHEAFAAVQDLQDRTAAPPTVSVIIVVGLAHPRFLIEVEALAVIA